MATTDNSIKSLYNESLVVSIYNQATHLTSNITDKREMVWWQHTWWVLGSLMLAQEFLLAVSVQEKPESRYFSLPSGAAADCRNAYSDKWLSAGDTAGKSPGGWGWSTKTRSGKPIRCEVVSCSSREFQALCGSRVQQQARLGGYGHRHGRRRAGAAKLDEAFRSSCNTTRSCWTMLLSQTGIRDMPTTNTLCAYQNPDLISPTTHFRMTSSSPKPTALRLSPYQSCRNCEGGVVKSGRSI